MLFRYETHCHTSPVSFCGRATARDTVHFYHTIGYDGINMAKIMNLTTYEQNTKELGQLAARKLIQMINEPHLPPERVIVSGKMFKGSTVKKIK